MSGKTAFAPKTKRRPLVTRSGSRPDREEIYDLLMNARQADWVALALRDGRRLEGAIIFNEFKGTGRLINIDEEVSVDFRVEEIEDVAF